ncbi:hypothetical protein [Actinopolymorpha alba]|uniref:hypothetical protein n=1 Tax=Actinopolymorpha alba TaxID=533267 RepID=UPI00037C6206|nr:hypothetical protein [Actinopolymorpha alba]
MNPTPLQRDIAQLAKRQDQLAAELRRLNSILQSLTALLPAKQPPTEPEPIGRYCDTIDPDLGVALTPEEIAKRAELEAEKVRFKESRDEAWWERAYEEGRAIRFRTRCNCGPADPRGHKSWCVSHEGPEYLQGDPDKWRCGAGLWQP